MRTGCSSDGKKTMLGWDVVMLFLHCPAFDFFSCFPLMRGSLWWGAETLLHQGMLITDLLPCELDSGAICVVFNINHRSVKLQNAKI